MRARFVMMNFDLSAYKKRARCCCNIIALTFYWERSLCRSPSHFGTSEPAIIRNCFPSRESFSSRCVLVLRKQSFTVNLEARKDQKTFFGISRAFCVCVVGLHCNRSRWKYFSNLNLFTKSRRNVLCFCCQTTSKTLSSEFRNKNSSRCLDQTSFTGFQPRPRLSRP